MVPVQEPVTTSRAASTSYTKYAWGVLAWNFFVVLWGAFVRASGSGAGCGSHWPLCNGEVVPRAPRIETIIEFTHRVTSGVALAAVVGLAVWSFARFPRGHRVRRMATLSVVFLIVEALLGAGLVLFKYVAQDASVGRAIYLSLHLVNTQLLLAVLALTAWYSRPAAHVGRRRNHLVMAALPVLIAVSVMGAIAALGDTLFPAASLAAGMRQDFSSTANFLLRLRVLHPALAIVGGGFCAFVTIAVLRAMPRLVVSRLALAALLLTGAQLGAGAMNLALLAPIWMQITHLLLADFTWVAFVLLAVEGE